MRFKQGLADFLQFRAVGRLNQQLRSRRALLIMILLVVLQQVYFMRHADSISPDYRRNDATGFNHGVAQRFFPFYYYTGQYPLTTFRPVFDYSRDSVEHIIRTQGKSLVNEYEHWSRFGDYTRIWFYLPNAWFRGSAEDPSIVPLNRFIFLTSLVAILFIFWRLHKPVQGLVLVALLSSSPFLNYEIHVNENLFGLITIIPVLFACLYFFFYHRAFRWWYLALVALLGLLTAILFNARGEILPVLLPCVVAPLFFGQWRWWQRLALALVFPLLFAGGNVLIKNHFRKKIAESQLFVAQHGGVPFTGGFTTGHPFWHPFFCGLGDFDTQKGYGLHDTVVYNYALPILRQKTGERLRYPGKTKYAMGEYYDSTHYYYKKPETLPGFEAVLKEKVFRDISEDPWWYAGILLKRVNYVFTNASPQWIDLGLFTIRLPYWGYLFFPLLLALVWIRQKEWLPLVFTLPMCSSGIIMFSIYNNSYINGFHFFVSSTLLVCLLEGLLRFLAQKRAPAREQ